MRVLRRLAVIGFVVSTLLYAQPWRGVFAAGLPFDPATADGRLIMLEGTVERLDTRVSHRGNAYFTFDLGTQMGAVRVFQFGVPQCLTGSKATVTGVFHRVKRVSGYTFYDQVDADRVTCR